MGRFKRNGAFERAQNAHSDHSAHAQSICCPFIHYVVSLKRHWSDCADVRMIWAFAVRICPKTFSHGSAHFSNSSWLFSGCEHTTISVYVPIFATLLWSVITSGYTHYNMYTYVTNWAGHSNFYNFTCAPSKDSDTPVRPRSLISVFAGRLKTVWESYP